jgi:hypothetical protein
MEGGEVAGKTGHRGRQGFVGGRLSGHRLGLMLLLLLLLLLSGGSSLDLSLDLSLGVAKRIGIVSGGGSRVGRHGVRGVTIRDESVA